MDCVDVMSPKFKDESLRKHKWLWKYDDRRPRRCSYNGHSIRWYRYTIKDVFRFIGLCKRCDHLTFYQLKQNEHSTELVKEFYKVKVVNITKEEADAMIAERSGTCQINVDSEKSQHQLDITDSKSAD